MKINAGKVSGPRKTNVKKVFVPEVFQDIEEDCTNSQIDLEECIIRTNPSAPPVRSLSDEYQTLYEERLEKFIPILKSNNYKFKQLHIFSKYGIVLVGEIVNYDEMYKTHVERFLSEFIESVN